MNFKPGKYQAKIKDYGLITTKNGSPQVKVLFETSEGLISWFSGLGSEKQQEWTTKNLLLLGATPSNINRVEDGIQSGVLNVEKFFEIVVEEETYDGKIYSKVKFINNPGLENKEKPFLKGTGALGNLRGIAAKIAAIEGISTEQKKPVDTIDF